MTRTRSQPCGYCLPVEAMREGARSEAGRSLSLCMDTDHRTTEPSAGDGSPMSRYKAKGLRKINPRNKPGPKPKDSIAAFEKQVRKAAHLVKTIEDAPFHTDSPEQANYVALVQNALKGVRLSAKEKQLIAYELRVVYGASFGEIAETLGYASPVGAFNAVQRMKAKMRDGRAVPVSISSFFL
jgi:hypothetical protein